MRGDNMAFERHAASHDGEDGAVLTSNGQITNARVLSLEGWRIVIN